MNVEGLPQRWPRPTRSRPIFIIGAGGVVDDAHLPSYRALKLEVEGLYDVDSSRATEMSRKWEVPAPGEVPVGAPEARVYDLAVPPECVLETLEKLPDGAGVLMQKPMGRELDEATAILECCRRKGLVAAVNFQLRFSPMMLALQEARERGLLGEIVELEVLVHCHMPWELWPFLRKLDRMELALHSIHYLDALRALRGEPVGVHARTLQHPWCPELASTRSAVILEFDPGVRAVLSVNHHHEYGGRFASSHIKVEGTLGAAVMKMGVNLQYPQGEPDELHLAARGGEWTEVPLEGSWFPDAFRGPMCNLQRTLSGEDEGLVSGVEDAWRTMALVEACYTSNAKPLTPVPTPPAG